MNLISLVDAAKGRIANGRCAPEELLIEEAKNKGVKHISLEATDMGRLLYERYGFVSMKDEMELPEDHL